MIARHKRKRRPVRVLVNAKRRRVQKQGRVVAQHLQASFGSPGSQSAVPQIAALRHTLQDLRQQILHDGTGRHKNLVAGALHDVDQSLAALATSIQTNDLNTKAQLVQQAKHALDRAQHTAKAAGHDWPL